MKKHLASASFSNVTNTLSLLQTAALAGWLAPQKLRIIKAELEQAFVETANQYTKRASSSIAKEIAECLYQSILMQCDIFLFQNHDAMEALHLLAALSIPQILAEGQQRILQQMQEARLFYQGACRYTLDVPCFAYQYVMNEAFPQFLRHYSARFDATNICTSIDYPLLHVPAYAMQEQGVSFLRTYYQSIFHENRFCAFFEIQAVQNLLAGYGRLYHSKVCDLFCNLAEIVLFQFLAQLLCDKTDTQLILTKADCTYLYRRYTNTTKETISGEADARLQQTAFSAYPQTLQYLRQGIPAFSERLMQHLTANTLEHFLVVTV